MFLLYNSLSYLSTLFFIFLIWTTNLAWDNPEFHTNDLNPINKQIVEYLKKRFGPFRVPIWGLSPILQSIWTVFGRPHVWKHEYKREILDTHSGGLIAVDWLLTEEEIKHHLNPETDIPQIPDLPSLNPDQTSKRLIAWCKKQKDCNCSQFEGLGGKPVIVLVPGLTNCSDTQYIRLFSEYCKENGWIPVVYIWRGLGGLPLTSPKLFEPGDTFDFELAVNHIRSRVGASTPMAAIGWSLGGNLLCKYLGERKSNVPFFVGASVGQGYDASEAFKRVPSYVLKRIGSNFQSIISIHKEHFESTHNMDEILQPGLTVQEFDERFSLKHFEKYRSTDDFYRANSCAHLLKEISIPVLLLNSKDDPVVPTEILPFSQIKQNQNLFLITTNYGGHLGFAKGNLLFPEKFSFSDNICLEWFNLITSIQYKHKTSSSLTSSSTSISSSSPSTSSSWSYTSNSISSSISNLIGFGSVGQKNL